MFDKEKRYITCGIDGRLPQDLQRLIWTSVDARILFSDEKIDYLQVFTFKKIDGEILALQHEQEQPPLLNVHYTNTYANTESMYKPADYYGKIIKYDTHWEVYLLDHITQTVLDGCKLGCEIRNIRKEWIKNGLAKKGDAGHNTKQISYNGKIKRHDCLIIEGGIRQPTAELPPQSVTPLPPTPVSDYAVEDTQAMNAIFGGDNDENAN